MDLSSISTFAADHDRLNVRRLPNTEGGDAARIFMTEGAFSAVLSYRRLDLANAPELLDAVAQLRINVFREWPYIYDGDMNYERDYLRPYVNSQNAICIGACDGDDLVGVSTGAPMEDHAEDFAAALTTTGYDLEDIYYLAESVLLKTHRGQGAGHVFFDEREAMARRLGRKVCMFCAVMREDDHPLKPKHYAALEPFWRKRGYRPISEAIAWFEWKDLNEDAPSRKPLQFWSRVI